MSTYTKTTFVDGVAPGISATELNKVGVGIEDAHSELATHEAAGLPVHGVNYGSAPPALTPDVAASGGVSANVSRKDHVHNVPSASASTITGINAEGTAATFARADHNHAYGDNSVGHDTVQLIYGTDTVSTGVNIGTGITPLSVPITVPSPALIVMQWQLVIERTAGGAAAATMKILPRNDGLNLSAPFQVNDINLGVLAPANGDRCVISGSAHQVLSGADTSNWQVFISKASTDTFDLYHANLTVLAYPI